MQTNPDVMVSRHFGQVRMSSPEYSFLDVITFDFQLNQMRDLVYVISLWERANADPVNWHLHG